MKKIKINTYLISLFLVLFDCVLINFSTWFAIALRFEFELANVKAQILENFIHFIPIHTVLTVLVFVLFRLYNRLWRFVHVGEAGAIVLAGAVSAVLHFVVSMPLGMQIPRSCYIIGGFMLILLTMFDRFLVRAILRLIEPSQPLRAKVNRRIVVIGAGRAGDMLINEIKRSEQMAGCKIVCVIDDDKNKIGHYLNGVKIYGNRDHIIDAVAKYKANEIIFAIPTLEAEEKAEILRICKQTDCEIKTLPGVYQLLNDEFILDKVASVKIEDLLGRDPIEVDLDSVMGYVKDKTVLVTGVGSIGSELCRQLANYGPKQLILFDVYENNAYEIQNELLRAHPELDLVTLIGSVRDTRRINSVMEKYRPDLVYHAAAHKHVPLMEDSPMESIKNNVFGTLKTVQAADRYGVKRFVLISTDKAVNPTNIMGATKRMCEMIVQMYSRRSNTDFVAVRFGNVLGSNGSVIPLFKRQIEEGGPVTVTDPDIIRYFMTIPEAASLVLQAGAFAKGGEIFVLDMGKPVKILDLAKNLIRLSGYVPYVDIDIKFTGLRPGEKKYEELLMDEEGLETTQNRRIFVGQPIEFDDAEFVEQLEKLRSVMMDDSIDIRPIVKKIVPTYQYKK